MIMQSHRDQRAAELQKKVSHGPRQEEHTSSVFHELYKSVESHDLSKTVPFHELHSLFIVALLVVALEMKEIPDCWEKILFYRIELLSPFCYQVRS